MALDAHTRFWSKVSTADGCWMWTGAVQSSGYGNFAESAVRGSEKHVLAHRFAYADMVGPIPDGLTIDHLCNTRRCVNPDHMETVPFSVNLSRRTIERDTLGRYA